MSELRMLLLAAGAVLLIGIYLYSRRAQNKSTARNTQRRAPSFTTFVSESDAVPQPREPVEPIEFVDTFDTIDHATSAVPEIERQTVAEDSVSFTEPASHSVQDVPMTPLYEQGDLPLPEELRPEPQDLQTTSSSSAESTDKKREKVIVINISAKGSKRFVGPDIVDALTAESMELGEFDIFHRRSGQQSLFSVASMIEPGKFDMANIDQLSTPGLTMFLLLPGPDSPVGAFTEMLSTARRLATTLGGDVLDESGSTLSRQAASHLREQIIEFAHRIR